MRRSAQGRRARLLIPCPGHMRAGVSASRASGVRYLKIPENCAKASPPAILLARCGLNGTAAASATNATRSDIGIKTGRFSPARTSRWGNADDCAGRTEAVTAVSRSGSGAAGGAGGRRAPAVVAPLQRLLFESGGPIMTRLGRLQTRRSVGRYHRGTKPAAILRGLPPLGRPSLKLTRLILAARLGPHSGWPNDGATFIPIGEAFQFSGLRGSPARTHAARPLQGLSTKNCGALLEL